MSSKTKMYTVDRFLGLNEAADGETELKMGQAAKMENFFISDGYNLVSRDGIRRIGLEEERGSAPILAVWAGNVEGNEVMVAVDFAEGNDRIRMYTEAANGGIQFLYGQDGALGLTAAEGAKVKIFAFVGKLFIMSSAKTVVWGNGAFMDAGIYVPLVITGADPAGGGTALENLNLLTPLRRIDFSADGESKTFLLPDEAVGVTGVKVDNVVVPLETAGSFAADSHSFAFSAAPQKGVGNVEFTYTTDVTQGEENRMRVVNMTLAESYNGATDTRLFLAGDGSNLCIYSGVPLNGDITELYFPAMNEVAVNMSASPVTGMVRHYSKLLVFKPDGAFTITYEPVTLTDGNTIAGFYLRSANREFGNEVMGQVQTVDNYPRTFSRGGIYEWRITSSYYQDERYAKRASDPVENSLKNAVNPVTCDDNHTKTYYIFLNDGNGTVLVNRYALDGDIWCMYKSGLCRNVRWAVMVGGTMVFATETDIFCFTPGAAMDDPEVIGGEKQAIKAVWESGYMDFGTDFRRKYSSNIYISMLPQSRSGLTVTAKTERRDAYMEKVIGSSIFSFDNACFDRWSFDMYRTPKIRRVRLKVKKFVYYKLILKVEEPNTRATVLSFDQQVRFSSLVK